MWRERTMWPILRGHQPGEMLDGVQHSKSEKWKSPFWKSEKHLKYHCGAWWCGQDDFCVVETIFRWFHRALCPVDCFFLGKSLLLFGRSWPSLMSFQSRCKSRFPPHLKLKTICIFSESQKDFPFSFATLCNSSVALKENARFREKSIHFLTVVRKILF